MAAPNQQEIIKNPIQTEIAPGSQTAGLVYEPYLGLLTNPDNVLRSKGSVYDYKIYAETLRDDTVKATFQQRRLTVISSPWEVEAGADDAVSQQAADALKENLSALQFDRITDQMLFAVYYGHAVGEVMWQIQDGMVAIADIKVRDRARFQYGIDGSLFLLRKDYQYEQMPDRKFWTLSTGCDHGDNPYGVGLAHYLYWPVYFKRMDIKFWLIFLEKFGMPTAMGKMPAGQIDNVETRKKLLTALQSIATDSAVIVPAEAEVSFLEALRTGGASYPEMKSAMDAAIAKIVLSQTMTTDAMSAGLGSKQAVVHEGVRDMVVKADADLVCESFNRTVVKWWTEYNFPTAVPPRVWRNTEPEADLGERAKRDQAIYSLGYEPSQEYIDDTYGEGWTKRSSPVPPAGGSPFGAVDPNAQPNDPNNPQNFAEANLAAALKAGNRADQYSLISAAQMLASKYEEILGQRVQQLVDYAETTGDFETFRKHLIQMLAEQPLPQTVQKIERANIFSRMLGALRTQR